MVSGKTVLGVGLVGIAGYLAYNMFAGGTPEVIPPEYGSPSGTAYYPESYPSSGFDLSGLFSTPSSSQPFSFSEEPDNGFFANPNIVTENALGGSSKKASKSATGNLSLATSPSEFLNYATKNSNVAGYAPSPLSLLTPSYLTANHSLGVSGLPSGGLSLNNPVLSSSSSSSKKSSNSLGASGLPSGGLSLNTSSSSSSSSSTKKSTKYVNKPSSYKIIKPKSSNKKRI